MSLEHFVYIVRCSDNTLYTGYTTDIKKRLDEHNGVGETKTQQKAGARYTRSRRPVRLFHSEAFSDKITAMQREYEIKQFTREQKEVLAKKKKKGV